MPNKERYHKAKAQDLITEAEGTLREAGRHLEIALNDYNLRFIEGIVSTTQRNLDFLSDMINNT
jgi:hypothetical protein